MHIPHNQVFQIRVSVLAPIHPLPSNVDSGACLQAGDRNAMRLDQLPRSDNVEDRREYRPRGSPRGPGGIGLGTILVLGFGKAVSRRQT